MFQQVLIYILAPAEQTCIHTSVPLAATCVGTWTCGGARGGHAGREQISLPVDVLGVNFWTRRTISRAVMEVKVGTETRRLAHVWSNAVSNHNWLINNAIRSIVPSHGRH